MATVVRVRKLSNPRRVRVKRRANSRRRNRKMSPKQIKHFGTKRQKAALKARNRRHAPRRVAVRHNRRRRNTAARSRHRKRSNPALLVTLGPAVNPHKKRRKNVAKAKRRSSARRRTVAVHHRRRRRVTAMNPARRHHRRRTRPVQNRRRRNRRNPTRVVYVKRRANRRRNRRNPNILGVSLTSKSGMKLIGGGLAGVAATKFIPTVLPTTLFSTLGTSTLATTAISGVSAFLAGWIASKFDNDFGAGVYFGGFMQTLSVALNGFLPSVYSAIGSPLSGFGDFAPGRFAVPQNPLRMMPASNAMPAPTGSVPVQTGIGRAYGPAY